MSRKKITLKDLDEFLKQQAASLVTPSPVSDEASDPREAAATPLPSIEVNEISEEQVLTQLKALAQREGVWFRMKLYDIIIKTLESQPESLPEDKMLINTALYLKSGERWKEIIQEYWRKKTTH